MGKLDGQVAIVVGASRGMGAAIAGAFAREGASVGLIARTAADLSAVAEEIARAGGVAAAAPADVRSRDQIRKAVSELREKLGPVDILVNSAGIGIAPYVQEMTEEEWDDGLDTNVKATVMAIQAVLPDMVSRKRGLIINIGSMSGLVPGGPRATIYGGGKWALMGISRSLSIELKPHNIRVTLLNPGTTDTPFRPAEYGRHPDWMQAEDVAQVALFVATFREALSVHEVDFSPTAHGW